MNEDKKELNDNEIEKVSGGVNGNKLKIKLDRKPPINISTFYGAPNRFPKILRDDNFIKKILKEKPNEKKNSGEEPKIEELPKE